MRKNLTKPRLGLLLASMFCILTARDSAWGQRADALPVEDALKTRSFGQGMPIRLSPDGVWLAYTVQENRQKDVGLPNWAGTGISWNAINTDIYILNILTRDTTNLTGGTGNNWLPTWSPDGHFLSFLSDRDGGGQARLWVWDSRNRILKKVSDVNVRADDIQWSSDSRKIVVTTVPEGLSVEKYVEKVGSDRAGEDRVSGRVPGSTVVVYEALATTKGGEQILSSDPWSLKGELRDLMLIDVANGMAKTILRGRRISKFLVSPEGGRVACTIPKRFETPGLQQILFDIIVVTLTTGDERIVASDIRLKHDGSQLSWSPDGSQLSYRTYGPAEQQFNCYVVDVHGGKPRNLTQFTLPAAGVSGPMIPHWPLSGIPLWNTRGDEIYFTTEGTLWRASLGQSGSVEVAGIPNRQIIQMIPQSGNRLWTAGQEKSTIVMTHDDLGKQDGFYKIDLTTGESFKLLESGQCYSCSNQREGQFTAVSSSGENVAYFAEDAQHHDDVWVSDRSFRKPQRLSHLNPRFDNYKMGAARLIHWLSDDGEDLQGALLLPSDYQEGKRYPTIVWVYGGSRLSNDFDQFGLEGSGPMNMQLLATRGYAVFFPDAPQHQGTPMRDLAKTVLPGVNKIIELGIADPGRLGIIGHSYGGYSTLALIVQTIRFKAAVEIDGTANLVGEYGEMGRDGSAFGVSILEQGQGLMGGTPWQFRERYIENSPIFYLDKVETPLLVIHGGTDGAVAPFLGDEVFVGLRRLGKNVEYAKYEGEGHAPPYWSYPNQNDFCTRVIAWFEKYLKASTNSSQACGSTDQGVGCRSLTAS